MSKETTKDKLPPIWMNVAAIGHHGKATIFSEMILDDKDSISGMATDDIKALIGKIGMMEITETNAELFFRNVPGFGVFMGDLDEIFTSNKKIKMLSHRWNCLWIFLESPYWGDLCRAIKLAEKLGVLDELKEDFKTWGFAYAFKNYNELVTDKNEDNAFLYLADDIDDDRWQLLNHAVSPLTRDQHELIHRRRNNAKRNASRKAEKDLSTAEILMRFWLPLSLWRMTTGEILDTITMLKSGGTADDYERDCKKVEKAVRELGLCKYGLEPNV